MQLTSDFIDPGKIFPLSYGRPAAIAFLQLGDTVINHIVFYHPNRYRNNIERLMCSYALMLCTA